MAETWIVDLRHFLEADGSIAPKSGRARRLARHFAAIVREITEEIGGEVYFPKVRYRRKPKRKACLGDIDSSLDPETGVITWACPACGDNGRIQGWEGTSYDFTEVSEGHCAWYGLTTVSKRALLALGPLCPHRLLLPQKPPRVKRPIMPGVRSER